MAASPILYPTGPHVSGLVFTLHCTSHFTLYSTLYTVLHTLHCIQHFTLYSKLYTVLNTFHCTPYLTMYSTLYTVLYTLPCSQHCKLHIPPTVLHCNPHFTRVLHTLCTALCCTPHFPLYSMHSSHCTLVYVHTLALYSVAVNANYTTHFTGGTWKTPVC